MKVESKDGKWWIVGAKWWDDHGPYGTQKDAREDMAGLKAFQTNCLDKNGNISDDCCKNLCGIGEPKQR